MKARDYVDSRCLGKKVDYITSKLKFLLDHGIPRSVADCILETLVEHNKVTYIGREDLCPHVITFCCIWTNL